MKQEKNNSNKKLKSVNIKNKNNEVSSNNNPSEKQSDNFLFSPDLKNNNILNIPGSKKSVFLNEKKNNIFDLKTKFNKLTKIQSAKTKPSSKDAKNKLFIISKDKNSNKKIFTDINNINNIIRKKDNFSNSNSLIEDIKQINDELDNNNNINNNQNNNQNNNIKNNNIKNNDEINNQTNSLHHLHFQKHCGIEDKCPICKEMSKKFQKEKRKKGLFDRIDYQIYRSISRDRFNQFCQKFSPKNVFKKGKNEFEFFSDDENKMKNILFNDAKKGMNSTYNEKKLKNLRITRNKSVVNCFSGNNNFNRSCNYACLYNDKNNFYDNNREGNFNFNKRDDYDRGDEKCEYKDEYPALFGYFNPNNEDKNKTNDNFVGNSVEHL